MKRALLALVFSGLFLNSSSAMASVISQCDALLAKLLGVEAQVFNEIDVADNCSTLFERLTDFINAGCVPLFDSGQLFSAHIRPDLPLAQRACTALNCDCGLDIPECFYLLLMDHRFFLSGCPAPV
jgi:hypothetical protein